MKTLRRQLKRFSERFARAIDREQSAPVPLNVIINNQNFNSQNAPGNINNNNRNFVTVYTGPLEGDVRLFRLATQMNRWLMNLPQGCDPSQDH